MKYIKSIAASLVIAGSALMTSCDPSDFGNINDNPNYPTDSYTYMQFKHAAMYVRNFIMTSSSYDPWPMEWSGYLAEAKNNQYGTLETTNDFGTGSYYYYPIKDLTKIIQANENEETKNTVAVTAFGSNNNQIGVCKTLRAFFFMTLSDIQGPIAYSEALQGDEGVFSPKFDAQKDVYAALDQELVAAYNMMDASSSLSSDDIFFGGDVAKWKKLNASLRMMMAIKLADVAPADGASRFAKAYADGAMTNVDDSFEYTFDTNNYAWFYAIGNQSYASRSNYFAPNKVFVDALKEYQDPRLFTYCTVGTDGRFAYLGTVAGADSKDFNAYKGVPHGLESNGAVGNAIVGACSVAPRYCETTPAYGLITTARTLLVEAEAATLGWINADAADLYARGIQASFDYEAGKDAGFDASQATAYIAAHPLPAAKDAALKEIVMQRFFAGFLTDGIEAWSDWRRYNVPTLPMYEGQILAGRTSYPYRLSFSSTDYANNNDQVVAALKDLSNGKDDAWSRVWWDVADNECPVAGK